MTIQEIRKTLEQCPCGDDVCMKCQDLNNELEELLKDRE